MRVELHACVRGLTACSPSFPVSRGGFHRETALDHGRGGEVLVSQNRQDPSSSKPINPLPNPGGARIILETDVTVEFSFFSTMGNNDRRDRIAHRGNGSVESRGHRIPAPHSAALAKIDGSVSIDGGGRMEPVQVAELLLVVRTSDMVRTSATRPIVVAPATQPGIAAAVATRS